MVLVWAMTGVASALGVGSTGAIGVDGWYGGDDFFGVDGDFFGVMGSGGFAPSLDLRGGPVIVQIHALEFTEALIDDEELYLGANVLFGAHEASLVGPWLGVVQPGFGLDILATDPWLLGITGQCRLGAEVQQAAGIGAYVVPVVGILTADGDADWIAGGSVQLSVWFGG